MPETNAKNNFLDLLASTSRLAIAAAIAYFAWQLAQVIGQVGGVTKTVDRVTEQIPPTLVEVREIRLEIGAIREQIPGILAEVAGVRAQIPPVLQQVEALNQRIDPILARVDATLSTVQETQRQLPQILATSNDAIAALNTTRDQVVPLVPPALEQIRLTREQIDPTLDRVEVMIDDAFTRADQTIAGVSEAGQQASEGAVKGFFTGLIKLPFELVGTLASPLLKTMDPKVAELLDEQDLELMTGAGNSAVEVGKLGSEQFWKNPKSGNSGSVTMLRQFELDRRKCVEARITISTARKKVHDRVSEFCRNDDGNWVLAGEAG